MNSRHPYLLSALLMAMLSICGIAASSGAFQLVLPDEFSRDQLARSEQLPDGRTRGELFDEQVWTRSLDAPLIEVVTPDAATPVQSPVDIYVKFEPGPGAKIVLDSLHIRYGVIGLDVTDRIRKAATVTEQGIRAKGAELPAGSHTMSIEIADSIGRKGKQKFKFRVGD